MEPSSGSAPLSSPLPSPATRLHPRPPGPQHNGFPEAPPEPLPSSALGDPLIFLLRRSQIPSSSAQAHAPQPRSLTPDPFTLPLRLCPWGLSATSYSGAFPCVAPHRPPAQSLTQRSLKLGGSWRLHPPCLTQLRPACQGSSHPTAGRQQLSSPGLGLGRAFQPVGLPLCHRLDSSPFIIHYSVKPQMPVTPGQASAGLWVSQQLSTPSLGAPGPSRGQAEGSRR